MAGYKDLPPLDHKNLSARQFGGMVRNVVNQYHAAPAEAHESGRIWYPRAYDEAEKVGHGDVRQGAGILAALSPQTKWDTNVRQAHEMKAITSEHIRQLRAKDRSSLAGLALNQNTSDNIIKAHRIREGEAPESVLPMSIKTGHFYANISDPENPHHVTVDSIAADVARNQRVGSRADRGLDAKGRYAKYVDVYKAAAKHIGEPVPNRVQATTWVAAPRVYGGQGHSKNLGRIL